jgi:ElaB/YqjD/DUF883 family membrane-anchored ribosome-binding protein
MINTQPLHSEMPMIKSNEVPATPMPELASGLADRAANKADQALVATKRAAETTANAVQSGLDGLRETVPTALTRTAAQADELTRRGIERARHASSAVRERAHLVGDQTVGYIRDEPVKAVLMAAGAGALAALLLGWLNRSRG